MKDEKPNRRKEVRRVTAHEHERAKFTLEAAIEEMTATGGNIEVFSWMMLFGSAQLFAEIHGPDALGDAMAKLVRNETLRLKPSGSA